jgi:hypothetical protein
MPRINPFGYKEAIKLCKHFGFVIDASKGKGGHMKAIHPTKIATDENGRRTNFIIIRGRKEYSKSFRKLFIRELCRFGFTEKELLDNL